MKRAPKAADDERIGWPEDKHLRGVYVRGGTAGGSLYLPLLDRMAERGMNMIVLDAKDYDGWLTYKSKVPLAIETNAIKGAPIRDMARTVRFAHAKGIRVAMRISCFEDEVIAHAKPDLVPRANWAPNRPYQIGWLDPANPDARAYIKDLVKEALDFGVDEIQLDYVRYPVLGVKNADFDATKGKTPKTIVIRNFVREVHALTQERKVPLSLDIFGIVAEGVRADIDALGQDPVLLAPECEVLSPMVYPSHYHAGYAGFEVPGNHPEIVGMATQEDPGHVEARQKERARSPLAASGILEFAGIRTAIHRDRDQNGDRRGRRRLAHVEPGADVYRHLAGGSGGAKESRSGRAIRLRTYPVGSR